MLFIAILGCATSQNQQTNTDLADFKTELSVDREFVDHNKTWINSEFMRINEYLEIAESPVVEIEIFPFHRNPDFKNCARIYGSKRIYAHSPSSLKSQHSKSGINPYCFNKTYSDLKFTLVHEYVHTRILLLLGENHLPKWVWEGIAVSLSGELYLTNLRHEAIDTLNSTNSINACEENAFNRKPYQLGGMMLAYLEKTEPGFIRQLILKYQNNKELDLNEILSKRLPGCSISSKSLKETLYSDGSQPS